MSFYQTLNPTTETVERRFELHTTPQMKAIVDRADHVWKTDWNEARYRGPQGHHVKGRGSAAP